MHDHVGPTYPIRTNISQKCPQWQTAVNYCHSRNFLSLPRVTRALQVLLFIPYLSFRSCLSVLLPRPPLTYKFSELVGLPESGGKNLSFPIQNSQKYQPDRGKEQEKVSVEGEELVIEREIER